LVDYGWYVPLNQEHTKLYNISGVPGVRWFVPFDVRSQTTWLDLNLDFSVNNRYI